MALFNTVSSANFCNVGTNLDSNFAMVPSVPNNTNFVTLVGTDGTNVLTERFRRDNGQRDSAGYGPLVGSGPSRKGFAIGPPGAAYAATLDVHLNRVVASGTRGVNDFLAVRFNDDGTLDQSFGTFRRLADGTPDPAFGPGGSIKIDFGSTSGITTDGAKSIVVRTLDNGTIDILLAGYTLDAATGKYRIALVDLLDDNSFHVT